MTSTLDEDELIARARQGDREAFADLYQRYLPMIYAYVRARVYDNHDAEDLTEQVFLRAFQTLSRYRGRGWPYSAFLYRVARNLLVDHIRRFRPELPAEAAEVQPDPALSADEALIQREEHRRLQQALDRLPADYQEVIRLRLLLSLPTATAAVWLGRSEGAVRVLLYRAVQALRRELGVEHE
ncbi:MAG: RNA polymerase sigma factor [Chloroflexi bacterium]|nr:RNA polymerase sigma factor [Chloroflexota bacterium]